MALDKKGRIELVVTAGFILVFLFILYGKYSSAKNKKTAPVLTPQAYMPAAAIKQGATERLKNMNWGRDPFMFGTAKIYSDEDGALALNGIAWDEKAPSAIINNKVVKVGDEVAGNKVADIRKDRVIVTKDGSSYELNLRQKVGQ